VAPGLLSVSGDCNADAGGASTSGASADKLVSIGSTFTSLKVSSVSPAMVVGLAGVGSEGPAWVDGLIDSIGSESSLVSFALIFGAFTAPSLLLGVAFMAFLLRNLWTQKRILS